MIDLGINTDALAHGKHILLSGQECAWRVVRDYAEIFLIAEDQPRRYLMRIEEGEVFTGLRSSAAAMHRQVIAIPSPEALVETISEFEDLSIADIEGWVTALTHSFATQRKARATELIPGESTAVDSRPVSPVRGLCWASPVAGHARLLGDRSLSPLAEGEWIPVTFESWLEPDESAHFEARTGEEVRAAGEMPASLARLYACALLLWNKTAEREELEQQKRAARQRQANRTQMAEAIESLASALRPREVFPSVGDDPWMACLREIGKAVHIDFHAPVGEAADDGASPVEAIARASGVRTRRVRVSAGWWNQDHGALLGQMRDSGLPVALLPFSGGYRLYDPISGKLTAIHHSTAAELEQFAISFYRPLPPAPVTAGKLLRFALDDGGPALRSILGISVASSVVALTLPVVTGMVFDHVLPQGARSQLALICSLLMVTAVASSLFNLTRGSIVLRLEGAIDAKLQAALWGRLLDLPATFYREYSSGDLAARGLGIQAIREAVTGAAANSLLSAVFSLITFALLFTYSVPLAFAGLALVLAAVLVTFSCGLLQLKYQRQIASITGPLSGLTLNIVHGIAKLRIAGAEPRAFFAWSRQYSRRAASELAGRRIKSRLAAFNAFWIPFCTALIFYFYVALQRKAALPGNSGTPMTSGDLIAFLSAFGIVLGALLKLASALMDLVAAGPAYERARPILEAEPEDSIHRSHPGKLAGAVELHNISFRYQSGLPLVVRNVSIAIRPGEFVAIVGNSGSGKTSLLRLLLGFETPETGTVLYDGRDLRVLDPRAVRRQAGVVLQNGRIPAGSIYGNIVGGTNLTLEDAWEAARMAGFDADIEAMPMGMHTFLGEGGGTLSGGQRQRLLIARALVQRPRILFFDEATSALDNATQAIVSRSLDQLNATRIVIAHRLSTVEHADRIYVMQHGELVEEGQFAQLMAHGGVFAELAKRQIL